MSQLLNEVRRLKDQVEELTMHLGDRKVPPDARNFLVGFRDHAINFIRAAQAGNIDSAEAADSLHYSSRAAVSFANSVLQLPGLSAPATNSAASTLALAEGLYRLSQTPEFRDRPLSPPPDSLSPTPTPASVPVSVDASEEHLKRKLAQLQQAVEDARVQVEKLQTAGNTIGADVNEQLESAKKIFEDGERAVRTSRDDFTRLAGLAAGQALNFDYAKSAQREGKAAELTRFGALVFMALVITVLVHALFVEELHALDWPVVSIRLFLAVALSIPAGYLARESIRHRGQQHAYLHTALNLQAITPFIASLPEEQQHALKSAMAERLFGSQPLLGDGGDTGIPNAQELMLKLLKELRKLKAS